jgi:hypothetical protein
MMPPDSERKKTTSFWLSMSWLWVGVPLLWGIAETVRKSLALFR